MELLLVKADVCGVEARAVSWSDKRNWFNKDQFRVTEQVCDEILSPPVFPQASGQQANIVAAEVKEHLMDSSINP